MVTVLEEKKESWQNNWTVFQSSGVHQPISKTIIPKQGISLLFVNIPDMTFFQGNKDRR